MTTTITTTAAEDARIASAFAILLQLDQNATAAQVKAWLIARLVIAVHEVEGRNKSNDIIPS